MMHPSFGIPNFGFAGVMGMMLFGISGVAIVFYIRFLRKAERFAVIGGKSRRFEPQRLGRWRWAGLAFFALWVFLAVVLPVLTLIWVAALPFLQPFSIEAVGQLTVTHFVDALDFIGPPLKKHADRDGPARSCSARSLVSASPGSLPAAAARGGAVVRRNRLPGAGGADHRGGGCVPVFRDCHL